MSEHSAQSAVTAAALALIVAAACMVAFLPPMVSATLASVPRTALIGVTLATALGLHWVFVGIAAHRLSRSVAFWVGFSVLLFPIGSVAALVLLAWLHEEHQPAHAA